jgi:cobalt-zinc-cadmium efflux system membrane fusion protein
VEGRLELTAAQSRAAGVVIATAAPGRIKTTVALPGEIRFNEDRTAHVVPRLAGVVEAVQADLGQLVKKGQVLAVIASTDLSEQRSELLARSAPRWPVPRMTVKKNCGEKISAEQDYLQAQQTWREAEIAVQNAQQKLSALGAGRGQGAPEPLRDPRALRRHGAGKHITLGEAVKEDANIFVISDLSTVWAEIAVPAKDLANVRMGGRAEVKASAFDASAQGTITYVARCWANTRTAKARITLANPDMAWRPGLFVTVEGVRRSDAPVTVQSTAIQTVEDKPSSSCRSRTAFGHARRAGPQRWQLDAHQAGACRRHAYAAQGSLS